MTLIALMARDMKMAGVFALVGSLFEGVIITAAIVHSRASLDPRAPFFLLIPIVSVGTALYMVRSSAETADRSCLFLAGLWLLLGANAITFLFFVAMHSGGV
jgi:hypothetical protein